MEIVLMFRKLYPNAAPKGKIWKDKHIRHSLQRRKCAKRNKAHSLLQPVQSESNHKKSLGTSLVAQWLRIRLPGLPWWRSG